MQAADLDQSRAIVRPLSGTRSAQSPCDGVVRSSTAPEATDQVAFRLFASVCHGADRVRSRGTAARQFTGFPLLPTWSAKFMKPRPVATLIVMVIAIIAMVAAARWLPIAGLVDWIRGRGAAGII